MDTLGEMEIADQQVYDPNYFSSHRVVVVEEDSSNTDEEDQEDANCISIEFEDEGIEISSTSATQYARILVEEDLSNTGEEEQEEFEGQGIESVTPAEYTHGLNEAYQKLAADTRDQIQAALDQTRKAERALSSQRPLHRKAKERLSGPKQKTEGKVPLQRYLPPYFRDTVGMVPPPNLDTVHKEMAGEMGGLLQYPKKWTESECTTLRAAVHRETFSEATRSFRQKKALVVEKRNQVEVELLANMEAKSFDDPEKKSGEEATDLDFEGRQVLKVHLEERIRELREEEELLWTRIENLEDQSRSRSGKDFLSMVYYVDWEAISKMDFGMIRSPEECRLKWENELCMDWYASEDGNRPTEGKRRKTEHGHWTKTENQRLKRLTESRNLNGAWEDVPKQLKIDKTPFQCFERYKMLLDDSVKTDLKEQEIAADEGWTPAETKSLRELVLEMRAGNHIPWEDVCFWLNKEMISNRSVYQVEEHAKQQGLTDLPAQWTDEDDLRLLIAIHCEGKRNWEKVSASVGRESKECRQRWQILLDNSESIVAWQRDTEYKRLRTAVRILGEDKWDEVGDILCRPAECCRVNWNKTYIPKGKRSKKGRPKKKVDENSAQDDGVMIPFQDLVGTVVERKEKVGRIISEATEGIWAEQKGGKVEGMDCGLPDTAEAVDLFVMKVNDPVMRGLVMASVRNIVFDNIE